MAQNKIVQLGLDLYEKRVERFSMVEGQKVDKEDVLRQQLFEICGISDAKDFNHRIFRKHRADIFQVVEEMLDVYLPELAEEQFNQFVEIRNIGIGDSMEFEVPNTEFFEVSLVAEGNGDLRAQRLMPNSYLSVVPQSRALKIYTPIFNFMAGRVDWVGAINKMKESVARNMQLEIYTAMATAFSTKANTNDNIYGIKGTLDYNKLLEMSEHVQAESGDYSVTIYGTKTALGQLSKVLDLSNEEKRELNAKGYVGTALGMQIIELKNAHKLGSTDLALNNKQLLLIPSGQEKILKLVFAGDTRIMENDGENLMDMSKETTLITRYGFAIIPTVKYGVYEIA